MRTNEALTNPRYEAASKVDMPEHVLSVVRANREDERRHLQYIEQCVANEIWELEEEEDDLSRRPFPGESRHRSP